MRRLFALCITALFLAGGLPGSLALAESSCARTQAPQRCEAARLGATACTDLNTGARQACVAEFTPPLVCKRQRDSRSCEALVAAHAACTGQTGAGLRACIRARLPAADCSRHARPERCQDMAEAEAQCSHTFGAARRQCVRRALSRLLPDDVTQP